MLALAALATGCSALKLGYSQAPTAAYWWLDRYADFDAEQAPRVRERIAAWLRWHRATQLPDYAALLGRAGQEVAADASAAQVCGWIDAAATRLDAAADAALPALAATAVTLSPAQIDRIERRLAKNNDKFAEEQLEGSREAVLERRIDKAVERSEMLYGRLDAPQREQIARNVRESPWDPAQDLAQRRQRQRELVALLRRVRAERLDEARAQAAAASYVEALRRPPDAAWRERQQRLKDFNCAAGAALHNLTTAAQRRTAARKLAGWQRDLAQLAAETAALHRAPEAAQALAAAALSAAAESPP